MRLLLQLMYKNSLIQVYGGPSEIRFADARVFLNRVDVTDYAFIDGGPAKCVERAKEIIDHYSRQIPTHASRPSTGITGG